MSRTAKIGFTDGVRLKLSPGEFNELAMDRRGRSADQDPVFDVLFAARFKLAPGAHGGNC